MKNITRRIFALALVALMALTVIGCKSKGPQYESYLSYYYEDDGTASGVSGDDAAEAKDSKTNSKKTNKKSSAKKKSSKKETQLEDVDLKGYKFVISSPWMAKSLKEAKMEQEKSFFKAAADIEKKTGCTITVQGGSQNDIDSLRPLIMSGSKVADCVDVLSQTVLGLASSGYIVPWDDVEGINPTGNNYVKGYTNLGTVNGKVYGVSPLRAPEARMCVVFNKNILSSAGIDANGIYTLVKNKKWNWSTFESYANTVKAKTGDYSVGGYYRKIGAALVAANNAKLVTYSGGKAAASYSSQNMLDALDFYNKLVNTDKVIDPSLQKNGSEFDSTDNGRYDTKFTNGQLAFNIQETYYVSKYFKPTNPAFKYGIAPVPMGPKATGYASPAYNARVWTCTSTNAKSKTINKTVAVMNALAERIAAPDGKYTGEKWWEYDLKKEYFIDTPDDNMEMYNICLNNSCVDYGHAVGSLYEDFTNTALRDAIYMGNGTTTAAIQKMGTKYDKAIKSLFTFK